MFFKKKSKIEMCEKLAHMFFAKGYNPIEAREILLETIGLLDAAATGVREDAEHSDMVRSICALPTVLNIIMNKASKHPDVMEAYILTLQDVLETAKGVSTALNNLRK